MWITIGIFLSIASRARGEGAINWLQIIQFYYNHRSTMSSSIVSLTTPWNRFTLLYFLLIVINSWPWILKLSRNSSTILKERRIVVSQVVSKISKRQGNRVRYATTRLIDKASATWLALLAHRSILDDKTASAWGWTPQNVRNAIVFGTDGEARPSEWLWDCLSTITKS